MLVCLLAQSAPTQWVTPETLFSLPGAAAAVFVVTTVLQGFLKDKIPAKVIGFVLALIICFAAIPGLKQPFTWLTILLAIVNAFITYMAAVGVNNVASSVAGRQQMATRSAESVPARRVNLWWD